MHLQDPQAPPPEQKSSPEMVLRAPRRCVESNSGVTLAYVIYRIDRVRRTPWRSPSGLMSEPGRLVLVLQKVEDRPKAET